MKRSGRESAEARTRSIPADEIALGPARARIPLSFTLTTERLVLRPFRASDVRALRAFAIENDAHLGPWSPRPRSAASARSIVEIAGRVAAQRKAWRDDRGYAFAVTLRAPGTRAGAGPMVGRVALNEIVRGAFQNAYLGYLVGAPFQGRGLAREAVAAALGFAFGIAALHRVQAAIMPHNARSLALARALGFREEGFAERYLNIDGDYRDHVIFAMTREDFGATHG